MRIRAGDDLSRLGTRAKQQIQAALLAQGDLPSKKRLDSVDEIKQVTSQSKTKSHSKEIPNTRDKTHTHTKKPKPSRIMRTADGRTYCPYPSTDPFVSVTQRLEAKYGRFDDGGMLLTELIIDGGAKNWRFDIALLSPFTSIDIEGRPMYLGNTCLVEADGFGFHRSKDAFKNDRTKQTHALKQGFALKRITNEDARNRLDEVIDDIELIFSQPRLYENIYTIHPKGKTQCVLRWK